MHVNADVLVVGLGPAGSAAAAAAARAGARVLAVDRRRAVGLPVQCAEFVPGALAMEEAGLATVTVQPVAGMRTRVAGSAEPEQETALAGRMIDRAAFDGMLLAAAIAAGAECRLGRSVRDLDGAGVAGLADGSTISARVIVAADGPRSRLGRVLGCTNRALLETRQIRVPLRQPGRETEIILTPVLRGGYAWLFPRGTEATLGVGADAALRGRLPGMLAAFAAALQADGRIGTRASHLTGGAIPAGGVVGPLAGRGGIPVLLAGDAAGLANPVTGAGIAAAVISGRLAGSAAAAVAAGRPGAGAAYAEEIEAVFGGSLRHALARRAAAHHRSRWIAFPEYWRH